MNEDPDDLLEKAVSLARKAYSAHVKDLGEEAFKLIKDRDIASRDDLDTWVRETVDGDGWVIYIRSAQLVLLASSNDGAAEEYGILDLRDGVPWSQLAFCAMLADLEEYLHNNQDEHGLDLSEDDLGVQDEDEDEEPESDPSP